MKSCKRFIYADMLLIDKVDKKDCHIQYERTYKLIKPRVEKYQWKNNPILRFIDNLMEFIYDLICIKKINIHKMGTHECLFHQYKNIFYQSKWLTHNK